MPCYDPAFYRICYLWIKKTRVPTPSSILTLDRCLILDDLDAFILSWPLVSAKPTLTEPSREIAVCISQVFRGGVGASGWGGGGIGVGSPWMSPSHKAK